MFKTNRLPVLEILPLIEDIRVSRVKEKTIFEMAETDPMLQEVAQYYLNIADQLLALPEGVVPDDAPDRDLFSLLSDYYLNPTDTAKGTPVEESEALEALMV